MNDPRQMTDAEIVAELQSDSRFNKARAVFSSYAARIEQSRAGPIEMRRLEFEAVRTIALILQGLGRG